MKTQELKIEAPEGYEVDWDNSSMNTIRFKPIKKKITYQDVKEKLFTKSNVSYFLGHDGAIMQTFNIQYLSRELLLSTSIQQLEQIRALNKLMNVAKYLNGDWKPNWNDEFENKFCIHYALGKLYLSSKQRANYGCVYFKSEKLALQAIEILGEKEIKVALGVFE